MAWVPVGYEKLKKAKAASRGFLPLELDRLNALIAVRTNSAPPLPQQGVLNFESVVPLETDPDSPFDLRVLKVTNEQVWMVEVRPKGSGLAQASVSSITPLTGDEATDVVG